MADHFKLSPAELLDGRDFRRTIRARKYLIFLLKTSLEMSAKDIAILLGKNHEYVKHKFAAFKDKRQTTSGDMQMINSLVNKINNKLKTEENSQ